MKWVTRGRQIGQAVKNAQRLKQILSVLSKNGFVDVIDRMNLGKFLPDRWIESAEQELQKSTPERLRKSFEELGPTFVKLGQLLSTRPDLIPESFIEEFTKLQDQVQPLPFEVIRKVLSDELGSKLDTEFESISEKPLAAASIGQVHEAVLKSGQKVVLKIQRPEIRKTIETDISILAFIASLLEKYIPETRTIAPTTIVEEFFKTLSLELDFRVEANNMQKIAQNMASFGEIVIPNVYRELSTGRVLTQEKLEGMRVTDSKALDAAGIDRQKIVKAGAKAFFQAVMVDGVFHGDLHAGNVFILSGSRLGIIDFGIVGRLSERARHHLASMMFSLVNEDYENLCYQYADLGACETSIDFDAFQREVQNTLAPYLGLSLREINAGKILIEATKIAAKYRIKIPGEWMIVFKALLTMEGMARSLDPDFDMIAQGQELAQGLVKNGQSLDQLKKEAAFVSYDLIQLAQVLPRHLKWFLKKWSRNDYAFELRSPDWLAIRDQIAVNGRKQSESIMASAALIASVLALSYKDGDLIAGYPAVSVVLFTVAIWLFIRVLRRK